MSKRRADPGPPPGHLSRAMVGVFAATLTALGLVTGVGAREVLYNHREMICPGVGILAAAAAVPAVVRVLTAPRPPGRLVGASEWAAGLMAAVCLGCVVAHAGLTACVFVCNASSVRMPAPLFNPGLGGGMIAGLVAGTGTAAVAGHIAAGLFVRRPTPRDTPRVPPRPNPPPAR